MTDQIQAIIRTAKPVLTSIIIIGALFAIVHLYSLMTLVTVVMGMVALYLLIVMYEINLHNIRNERKYDPDSNG